MTVRRSVIFKQTFVPRMALATDPLKGFRGVKLPQLDGYVVTTAKDRVKIEDPASLPLPLWTLQVGMGLVGGGEELARRIAELARR